MEVGMDELERTAVLEPKGTRLIVLCRQEVKPYAASATAVLLLLLLLLYMFGFRW